MKYITVDGNEATARTSYFFTEIATIYPITPASPMAEYTDKVSNKETNLFGSNVSVIQMQSEAGAIAAMHGSLLTGTLTTTYTASQGLLLMLPNMYKIAGELLPGVIHVASRTIATHALSIMGDHSDIYAARNTGFAFLSSSSVQDCAVISAISYLASIESSIPFVHFFDGFRTSHEINKIKFLEKEDYLDVINYNKLNEFRTKSLSPNNPKIQGTTQGDDIYFQNIEARNNLYNNLPNIVIDYMNKINKIGGFNYQPFNYYGSKKATKVIITMGSICNTTKLVIDDLIDKDEQVGLLEVHLFRPFSSELLIKSLPKTVKKIAVLDKAKETTSREALYLDILSSVSNKIEVIGGRYGLSGKDTNYKHIKSVYDYLDNPDRKKEFTVGIDDDITNLSIPLTKYNLKTNNIEIKIYGYGSDGMIGSSKEIIKIIGENTDLYPQGYFEYDSKKSGGLTISHLRIGKEEIKESYYITKPNIVVISKESYLRKYNCLEGIKVNSIVILNTHFKADNITKRLPDNVKKIIMDKKLKLYTIPANEISIKNNLGNKIGMILETAIFSITNLYDKNKIIDILKRKAYERFRTKGENIVNENYKAIDMTLKYIKEETIFDLFTNYQEKELTDYELITKGEGNKLSVSSFMNQIDGRIVGGNTYLEKRKVSSFVPTHIKENCIQCNACSFICPHAVIRPYILTEKEIIDGNMQDKVIPLLGKKDLYYMIGISNDDCTGCKLCTKVCPGKKGSKALVMESTSKVEYQNKDFNYLNSLKNNYSLPLNIISSQYLKPYFEFSGACSGCGETAYLKLISQLYGPKLMIANATGCSSIYGASYPSMPYSSAWANSLFEDNAEFGYGMFLSYQTMKNKLMILVKNNLEKTNYQNKELLDKWLENYNDDNISNEVYNNLDYNKLPSDILNLKQYFLPRTFFIVGGDGFAYDIGYGGLDHVLSTKANINILILDTEAYSNTGGQASKSTPMGSVALFASLGKVYHKKDLAKMALNYPHVYVATVNMGYNRNQYFKAITEAVNYDGPSIIIAYSPCIAHGIQGGMENSLEHGYMATNCGYYPLFRYNPNTRKLEVDSKDVNFDTYFDFLMSENRYKSLYLVNKEEANTLLEKNKKTSIERYNYYINYNK